MQLKVYGVGRENDFTFVIFGKDQDFFKSFSALTKKAFGHACYSHEVEKEAAAGKVKVKRVADYTDRHERCYDPMQKTTFDLFFGSKKVFVMVHAPAKARAKFMSALEKSAKWFKR
jgi:hypothetical protein